MSGFTTALDLRKVGPRHWMLIAPLRYTTRNGEFIEVPAGFFTDLASIPRPFWNLFPPVGSYDLAAVLHDYLYRTDSLPLVDQKRADRLMLEAMEDTRVGWWRRRVIHRALRLFGNHAFHQHPANWVPQDLVGVREAWRMEMLARQAQAALDALRRRVQPAP